MSPSRFRQLPAILSRDVGGEIILTAVGRDEFDCLSETAAVVWRELEAPRTVGDLAASLAARYRTPPDVVAQDIRALLDDLLRRNLIEETAAGGD